MTVATTDYSCFVIQYPSITLFEKVCLVWRSRCNYVLDLLSDLFAFYWNLISSVSSRSLFNVVLLSASAVAGFFSSSLSLSSSPGHILSSYLSLSCPTSVWTFSFKTLLLIDKLTCAYHAFLTLVLVWLLILCLVRFNRCLLSTSDAISSYLL